MTQTIHHAVMIEEVVNALRPRSGGRYLDATLGGGTHTAELLERSAPDGKVMYLAVDVKAIERARGRLQSYGKRWTGVEANFRHLADAAREQGMVPLDGILLDLGLSSDELSDPSKGLSFKIDGPLD